MDQKNTRDTNVELKAIIEMSSLSSEDKQFWGNVLNDASPKLTEDVLDFLIQFPKELPWATAILKKKIGAIKNKDENGWKEILLEEGAKVDQLLS